MADLIAWMAKRVGIPLVLATFGVSISLIAALVVWALPAFYAPPAWIAAISASKLVTATWQAAMTIGLVIGGIVGAYKFDLFREGKPHLTIELAVSSRPINDGRAHVGAIARLQNTSRVGVKVESVDWELSVISPYSDNHLERLIQAFRYNTSDQKVTDESEDASAWVEFPWQILVSGNLLGIEMMIEPGETEQITYDFVVPSAVEVVSVSMYIENMEEEDMGWSRREFQDIKERTNVQNL